MTNDTDDADIDVNEKIHFNGIDADTGAYLFAPMSAVELARLARGNSGETTIPPDQLAELKFRKDQKDAKHYGLKEGSDPTKLEEAGWGIIFPAIASDRVDEQRKQNAIYEALSPLLSLRKSQATKIKENYYKEYRGVLGYRPGELKQKYLARLGAGPGSVDPRNVPYYLLIVGSPQAIPYHIQYQIDVQYAVGRIHFDTVEEYANYARSVVAAETSGLTLAREVAFVGVAHDGDAATQGSLKNLVTPLADMAAQLIDVPGWSVSRYFGDDARKVTVSQLFGGPKTPALLFTGSHGMSFPRGDKRQESRQGALLLQDWQGPESGSGPIGDDLYFSGEDMANAGSMLGMIAFNFACYGAGTPEFDEFSKQSPPERKSIADRAFVSGLHRRMLGHPKGGALATIGHVERVWDCSFMWNSGKNRAQAAQIADFESTLRSLMRGKPVGLAVEYFNQRYAEMASDLSEVLEDLRYEPGKTDDYTLASMWTSSNDARGYAVTGDPAVRIPLGNGGNPLSPRSRESIDISSFGRATAAVAFDTPTAAAAAPVVAFSASATPAVAAAAPVAAVPASATSAVSFGFFGGDDKVEDGEAKPGLFQDFVAKVLGTLGKAVEDAMTLEVRTYVSSNVGAAASVDRATLIKDGDLRAFTRIRIDGDMDVIIPERDGGVDTVLWNLHLELVKQAQATRADTIKTVLSSISGLIKV